MEDKKEKVVEKKSPIIRKFRVTNYGKDILGIYDNDGKLYTLKPRMFAIVKKMPEARVGLLVEEIIGNDKYKSVDVAEENRILEKKRIEKINIEHQKRFAHIKRR